MAAWANRQNYLLVMSPPKAGLTEFNVASPLNFFRKVNWLNTKL